jgi:hypothetical protein
MPASVNRFSEVGTLQSPLLKIMAQLEAHPSLFQTLPIKYNPNSPLLHLSLHFLPSLAAAPNSTPHFPLPCAFPFPSTLSIPLPHSLGDGDDAALLSWRGGNGCLARGRGKCGVELGAAARLGRKWRAR